MTSPDLPAEDFTGAPLAKRGPYQQVYSGRPFYLLDPQPDDISIDDIAAALAKQCRYTGHCETFYSVAQHSVMVSRLVAPRLALMGLLHDAAEAYTGDITRPMKRTLEARAPGMLTAIVKPIEDAIWRRFGINPDDVDAAHDEIKRADNVALATERRDLMADTGEVDWGALPPPLPTPIRALGWKPAGDQFRYRFNEIMSETSR